MIDTHIHILPHLDDGAKDLDTALEMARMAWEDGTKAVIATPHVIPGAYNYSKAAIIAAVENLQNHLQQHKIPLTIMPGAEYYFDSHLPERAARGELLTLNDTGRYLLIEFPAVQVPEYSARILYELQLQGITPIIAHPERNQELSRNSKLLADFVSRGMYAQVTAASITGVFGKIIQNTAKNLMRQGLIHIIASDAHTIRSRSPLLSPAGQKVASAFGTPYAERLLRENPQAIARGNDLLALPVTTLPPSGWVQRIKKKLGFN